MTQHVAFVSGSGRNIGRAIALELAGRGCSVITNGSSSHDAGEAVAQECRDLGVDAMYLGGSVGDPAVVKSLAAKALDHFGKVDIVVNNAAIRPATPFLELDEEEWSQVLGVNLHAHYYTSRAFLPKMVEQGWGRIVNITGMNAIHGYAGRAHVSVSKHGAWGMTKSLAKEFGPNGITVNAISPGPIGTEHPDDPAMQAHIEEQASKIPVGRLGKPEEIAALAGFLCSDGGAFVNAQMIACNGGTQT